MRKPAKKSGGTGCSCGIDSTGKPKGRFSPISLLRFSHQQTLGTKTTTTNVFEMDRWILSQLYLITSTKRTFCPPISSNPIHMSSHPIPISRNPAHLYHIYQVIQYLYQPPISSNPIPMSSHPTPISSHLYQVIQHNHFVTHCHILLSKRSGSFPYKSCIVVWSMTTAVHWFAGT